MIPAPAAGGARREQPILLAIPRARSGWEQLAAEALVFLMRGWREGFVEAAHGLPFARAQGFGGPAEWQVGDVFARALVTDALIDAEGFPADSLAPFVDAEIEHLLDQRRTDGFGGWAYFPGLAELPPDADDLAQMMTVLVRAGRREAAARFCQPALDVLLTDCVHANGSFETWIVPARDRTPRQELQQSWIQRAWGAGPDLEVVANLLYALAVYDRRRYTSVIERGARYLAGAQGAEGAWAATWYHGPFYPTFAVLRLLGALGLEPGSRERAVRFLIGAQGADGAWGGGGPADPSSTALALLALAAADALDQVRLPAALAALRGMGLPGGGWERTPFIRMDLGRASGRVHQTLEYGSRTVTTSFVLKAALAIQRAGEPGVRSHHESD